MELDFEKEKIKLIQEEKSKTKDQITKDQTLWLENCGVSGKIVTLGHQARENGFYLKGFFDGFNQEPSEDIHFKLFYQVLDGDLSHESHPYWNEANPDFRLKKRGHEFIIIQRDFVATMDLQARQIWAMGPNLTREVTDAIDNIMMIVFSYHSTNNKSLTLHAATVERNGEAEIFFGDSEAGKTTLALQCLRDQGYRILGDDQVQLKIRDGVLFAHPCTCTIGALGRKHSGWLKEPRPVKRLVHLVKKKKWSFSALKPTESLQYFLRQIIYYPEFGNSGQLLNLASDMVQNIKTPMIEMSYPKGENFWKNLDQFEEEITREEAI